MNLTFQFEREQSLLNKESVLNCLKAFLGSINFRGKRCLIEQFNGLDVIGRSICSDPSSEIKQSNRLQKKLYMLLYDLVLNDDNILNDGKYVRKSLGESTVFMTTALTDLDQYDADTR